MRLQKRFSLVGRAAIDGLIEVFNVFNHANYGSYTTAEQPLVWESVVQPERRVSAADAATGIPLRVLEDTRMSTHRWYRTVAGLALIGACGVAVPREASMQSPASAAGSGPAVRGEAWFYQRCSLCHIGRIVKDDTYQPMAPRLDGVLKNASPDREKTVRGFIQQGSLRMPGFRYNFTPAEFEELMAYLKTL